MRFCSLTEAANLLSLRIFGLEKKKKCKQDQQLNILLRVGSYTWFFFLGKIKQNEF